MELPFGQYKIRSFRKSDAAALVGYGNNRNVSRYLRDSFPYPYRKSDAEGWLRYVANEEPESNFAIADSTELIGGIGLRFQGDVYRCGAELGYWLGEPHWGKGIVSAAVKVFVGYAFETFEIERLWATVYEGNVPSARVLEKAGFEREGILRRSVIKENQIFDSSMYALLREH